MPKSKQQSYSYKYRLDIERMYVVEGISLAVISQQTGVPEITLKSWSKKRAWGQARDEYQEALVGAERKQVLIQDEALDIIHTKLQKEKGEANVEGLMKAASQLKRAYDAGPAINVTIPLKPVEKIIKDVPTKVKNIIRGSYELAEIIEDDQATVHSPDNTVSKELAE